ncbi:MAG: hypothetical protein J6V44_03520 [Methanobrevibacter sp.]|nr:hypothetical protein [Methanobrevibacter sp.]
MTIEFAGETYKNMEDYMENGYILVGLDERTFTQREIRKIKQNNYQGILKFTVYEDNPIDYEFICLKYDLQNQESIMLKPIMIPNRKIFSYFTAHENIDDNETEAPLTIQFIPYTKKAYKTKKDELIDFFGFKRKMKEGDLYVVDDGINYQVVEDIFPSIQLPLTTAKDLNVLFNAKRDNYMGTIRKRVIYNTGEHAVQDYNIQYVDEENMYLEPISPRNVLNIMGYIHLNDDYENDIINVCVVDTTEYIPYSESESL